MTLLGLGVIGSSAKENEHRLPLHQAHLPVLDADLRARITLEHGYGARFGVTDDALGAHIAQIDASFGSGGSDPGVTSRCQWPSRS